MHARLDEIIRIQGEILREVRQLKEETRMATIQLQNLIAAVTAEKTVVDSAVAIIDGIPALIAAAGTDPAALDDLTKQIQVSSDALKAAVLANTPATPAPASPDPTTAPPATPPATT